MHNIYKEVGSDLGKNIPAHKLETTRQANQFCHDTKTSRYINYKLSIYYSFKLIKGQNRMKADIQKISLL